MVYRDRFPNPDWCEFHGLDFHTEVLKWMSRRGMRIFNARRPAGLPRLDKEQTTDALVQDALDECGTTIAHDDLWKLADKAADLVLIENSEEALHDWHVTHGRAGGRKSKRPPVLVWDAEEHGDIDGYTNAQVREILQCGERVVSTIRKRAKAKPVEPPKPERVKTPEQRAATRARREFKWTHRFCKCTTEDEHPERMAALLAHHAELAEQRERELEELLPWVRAYRAGPFEERLPSTQLQSVSGR